MTPEGATGAPDREIRFLRGAGPRRAAVLERLGIRTIGELLLHLPTAYLDRSRIQSIAGIRPATDATISAEVVRVDPARSRGMRGRVVARLRDESGEMTAVWFGRPYLAKSLRAGQRLLLSGRVRERPDGPSIAVAEFEILEDEGASGTGLVGGRIVPVYPLTAGLSQKILRGLIRRALDEGTTALADPVPEALLERVGLVGRGQALRAVHFPENLPEAGRARRRLAFDELLLLQLLLFRARAIRGRGPRARALTRGAALSRAVRDQLAFRLTGGQDRAVDEIQRDLARDRPAMRLLQGDVGSGKTVVAALACAWSAGSGCQSCFMAPTEVLAMQLARVLSGLLEPAGLSTALLLGRTAASDRRAILHALAAGELDILIGTHALLEPDVRFRDLGLVVVDEQHRFGVLHRLRLLEKGLRPHTLVMSATPIPRTLALAFYGDLDITTIDEIPPGRTPIRTRIVPRSRWDAMLSFIADRLRRGHQAFFVYPLIAESEALDLRDATRMHEAISRHPALAGLSVGLLHGRTPPAERDRILDGLWGGSVHALVSTTVVEVGIDLPRATVMVVENPERFGLAQLHQLRGRIGRAPGETPYFFLVRPERDAVRAAGRLRILVREADGFRIAEEDLRMRGPGEILGARQAGLPHLGVANLSLDRDLLIAARAAAQEIAETDPECALPDHARL